jgi:excisionase family DNA binding protein
MLTNILTTKELSEILKIKPKTLYQWAELGQIPCMKINGCLRFDLDDILKWIKNFKKISENSYNPFARPRVPERREKRKNGTL